MKIVIKKIIQLLIPACLIAGCNNAPSGQQISGQNFAGRDTLGYEYIDIVHSTHTDYGYTDHPVVAIDLHKRFIDVALDLALKTQNEAPENRFYWTNEALDPLYIWWKNAPESRRNEMLKMIENKQISVNAMPFHVHPFINGGQWNEMADWVPDELFKKWNPKTGIQHDVNGFPRAAALKMLDKNVNYIWTGINPHWGGSPFELPTAFWWKMPDNRKMLVWAGYPYWQGYLFFAEHEWRIQQREYASTETSWPRIGDLLLTDEASMCKAHEVCIKRLEDLRRKGYDYPFLALAFTNEWRCDNDGPMPQLLDFIKKWNEMGLKPALRMTTIDQAMERIEKKVGENIDTFEGEWQDWWSFGGAAMPRETQTTRRAAQCMNAIQSSFWGEASPDVAAEAKQINQLICRYFEHTFGSNESSERPFTLFNLGNINEKGSFAYRSWERARYLLAQQVRSKFADMETGLYVVNTASVPYTGWVKLDAVGFRGTDYKSVRDVKTNTVYPLFKEGETVWRWVVDEDLNTTRVPLSEGTEAWFWVKDMPGNSYTRYILETQKVEVPENTINVPVLTFDKNNWITSATWKGMDSPLFTEGLADFMVLNIKDQNRWSQGDIYMHLEDEPRLKKMAEITEEVWAKPIEQATIKETPYSWVISQEMSHPRVQNLIRKVEIYKEIPRAKVQMSFDRLSSRSPEVFYAKFPLPENCKEPLTTNGGVPFAPYKDQLPNSCKDFFVVDSWVKYETADGTRIWSSRDIPLINFGGHHFGQRLKKAPGNTNELYGMLYNNVWVVNFLVDAPGDMSFEFDLTFDKNQPSVYSIDQTVGSYYTPMPIMNNPEAREDPVVNKYLNTPQKLVN